MVLTGGALGVLVFGVALGMLVAWNTGPAAPDPMATAPPSVGLPAVTPPPAPGGSSADDAGPRPIPKAMLEGMLQAARASLNAGRYEEAVAAYQAVLKREPENVDALTHFGAILAIAGHTDPALGNLDRALALQPDYAEALWYKAGVLYQLRQDYAGAIAAWERFRAVAPAGPARDQAQTLIREARARLAGTNPVR